MENKTAKLTANLVTPQNKSEFTKEWARRIIVDYTKKTDPDWLLARVLKVLDVMVKDNPHPGMLSNSYIVDVSYTQGGEDLFVESWFVKAPLSSKTYLLDEMEVFMYDKMLPLLQAFASKACVYEDSIQLPIPVIYHCAYDEENTSVNVLVMENLKHQGYKPLRPETCGLVFMRAAMTSLASVHATAFAYQTALGGRLSFLTRFPLIKEDNMPKAKLMKDNVEDHLEAYLDYMGLVAPDIGPQAAFLKKFHRFLLGIFHDLQKDKEMWKLKIMVHGDSKIDNFMFRKNPWAVEEEYTALMIDWQGVAYDLLSGDLMWALYGFLKNLPDKLSTVDTFVDYSINFYHQELIRLLELMHVDMAKVDLPTHEYDATVLIRRGFLYDFLKTILFKPLLTMKGKDLVKEWFDNKESVPLPDEKDVFKTGTNFVNYFHLMITIATEVGVFHDLAPLCIQAMKDAMFGQINNLEDDEDEVKEDSGESIEDILSQAAAILKDHDDPKLDEPQNTTADDPSEIKASPKVSVTESIDSDGETVKGTVFIKTAFEEDKSEPMNMDDVTAAVVVPEEVKFDEKETSVVETKTEPEPMNIEEPKDQEKKQDIEDIKTENMPRRLSIPPAPTSPPPKLPDMATPTTSLPEESAIVPTIDWIQKNECDKKPKRKKKKTFGKKIKKQEVQKEIQSKIQGLD